MESRSSPPRRTATQFLLAMMLCLAVLQMPSVAAAPPTLIHEANVTATTFAEECSTQDDGSTVCVTYLTQIFLSDTNGFVCILRSTVVTPPNGDPTTIDAFGCGPTTVETFTYDRNLTSATLQPTTVPLFWRECDAGGACTDVFEDVTVSVEWTGIGPIDRFREKTVFHEGPCRETVTGRGESRAAAATTFIDGRSIPTDEATLVSSRIKIMVSVACS
jgi:hypothetical protein